MSITTEVLNTTFADLRGPLVNSFMRSSELWMMLQKKSKMPIDGGTFFERTFAGGAPARGVGVFVGDELLNMQRRQEIRRYQVEPHRLVIAINIPNKELQMNSGQRAVVRLLEESPKTTLEAASGDINSYLLTGSSRGLVFQTAELLGLTTFNGHITTGVGTGVANGLLDFEPIASQTEIVQNVAKSSSYFHYNQYGEITAWGTDGMETYRKQYRKCAHHSGMNKGPDLVIMDDDSFTNFDNDRLASVRLSLVEDKTEKSNMLALDLGMAKVLSSIDLDRGDTNFAATGTGATVSTSTGVGYLFNTDHIQLCLQAKPTLDKFKERVGDQDVVTAKFSTQFNTVITNFPALGCIAGGAV